MKHGAAVFRVKLCADKPAVGRYLDYLNEIAVRVVTHTMHAVALKLVHVGVVKLIAVAVALTDVALAVYLKNLAALC